MFCVAFAKERFVQRVESDIVRALNIITSLKKNRNRYWLTFIHYNLLIWSLFKIIVSLSGHLQYTNSFKNNKAFLKKNLCSKQKD